MGGSVCYERKLHWTPGTEYRPEGTGGETNKRSFHSILASTNPCLPHPLFLSLILLCLLKYIYNFHYQMRQHVGANAMLVLLPCPDV